jgi:hypothetical protein
MEHGRGTGVSRDLPMGAPCTHPSHPHVPLPFHRDVGWFNNDDEATGVPYCRQREVPYDPASNKTTTATSATQKELTEVDTDKRSPSS